MEIKRILTIIIAVLLVVSFTACSKKAEKKDNDALLNTVQEKDTGNKINGKIIAATDFSDGLAFVKLDNDTDIILSTQNEISVNWENISSTEFISEISLNSS